MVSGRTRWECVSVVCALFGVTASMAMLHSVSGGNDSSFAGTRQRGFKRDFRFASRQKATATRQPASPSQGLINESLQRQLNPAALRGRLHHTDHEHVVDRIDEEERAGGAVPAVF